MIYIFSLILLLACHIFNMQHFSRYFAIKKYLDFKKN
jgi:hypothetical protein